MADETAQPEVSPDDPRDVSAVTRFGETRATVVASPTGSTPTPKRIGQYHLKRVIGHGGMGTVYEAVQENPSRVVALKVMKPGIASPSSLRRFEDEARILGRLRHAGIAQVYEAGTHDDGSGGVPFFVMEYVTGARIITEHARVKHLSPRQRIELFCRVCDAVHHGHQKGIIHRDLKPDNILVDSSGQPKIIDFGIARATDANLAMVTLQTRVGDLVGTLPYMSPEQVEADPHDLDIRSDVYALGVVLYELLCGQLPYDLADTAVYEATRIIREATPRPMRTHDASFRGDVEAIVFKALEKDRERRYSSASGLLRDLQRYLDSEPVSARRPSITYHLRLFARRNRALFVASAVATAALFLGCVAIVVGFVQAREARDAAQQEANTAKAVTGYFQDMFASLDFRDQAGPNARVGDLLDTFAGDVDSKLADEPEVRAVIKASIGNGYRALTLYDEAERHLEAALETQRKVLPAPHEETARTMQDLASVLWFKHDYEKAERLYRAALETWKALRGDEHEDVANCQNLLAAAVDMQDRHDDAESLYRDTLAMRQRLWGPRHELVARSINNLATCFFGQRRYHDAEPLYREATRIWRTARGDRHIDVASGLSNLARCLVRLERFGEAERHFREALDIKLAQLGPDHADLSTTQHHFASLLYTLGAGGEPARLDEAETLCREALRIRHKVFTPPHGSLTATASLLGRILVARERWTAAEPILRDVVRYREEQYPEGHDRIAVARERLAACLVHLEQFREAEQLYLDAYTWQQQARHETGHPQTVRILRGMIALYHAWSKPAEARPYETLLEQSLRGDSAPES